MLLMVAMAASPPMTLGKYVPKMVWLFRLLLWASVVISVVLPTHTWHQNFGESFLPGFALRFSGVGGHANGMGAIAGMAILLELDQILGHGMKRWLSFLQVGLGSVLLLLTQSKTALIACVVAGVYLLLTRKSRLLPRGVQVVVVATTVLVGSVGAWSALSEWVSSNKQSLGELTGRLSLWSYYWELGLERPWFGHGTSLWAELLQSASFRYGWAAGNAHNQIVNSFVMAGVFGVVFLFGYVIGLFLSRRRIDIQYRALFTACLMFMSIRSFAEAGFEPGDLGVVSLIQVVLIGFCLCARDKSGSGVRRVIRHTASGTDGRALVGRIPAVVHPGVDGRNPVLASQQ
jgi:hypothetical protein